MVSLTAPRALVSATHRGAYALVAIDAAGHQLRADAAASVERMHAAGLPRGNVTSAYRTASQQSSETKRAAAGQTPSAAATGTSWHEAALAVDWPEPARAWVRAHGAEYGWVFTLDNPGHSDYEPWHAVYVPEFDQHAHQAAHQNAAHDTPPEDTMLITLVKLDEGAAAWQVIPEVGRRHATAEIVAAWRAAGHTVEVVDVPGDSPLWALPIVGSSPGDYIRARGTAEVYIIGAGRLEHIDAARYAAIGSPQVVDVSASNSIFRLPRA